MKVLKSIGNLFLALLLMISTIGMTVNKHYCMGELKSVAINQHVETCVDQMKFAPEDFKMDCCKDTTEEYQVDEFQKIDLKTQLNPDFYPISMVSHLILDFDIVEEGTLSQSYSDYSPPPIEYDIPVMIQSFLL